MQRIAADISVTFIHNQGHKKGRIMNKVSRLIVGCVYCALVSIASAGTQYLSSETWMNYGPGRQVLLKAGQTVTFDDGTGYLISGNLSTSFTNNVAYSSTRSVLLGLGTFAQFAGGYLSSGYLTSNSTLLYYGASSSALFSPNSLVTFSGGYVASGYVTSSFSYLPYGPSRTVEVNIAAKVEFAGGYLSKCVLASPYYIYYGPSRQAYMRASGVFTTFAGGYLAGGVTETNQYLTTSGGLQYVLASTIVAFSGGYYTP